MTMEDLEAAVANARERGHRWIMLIVPREPSGRSMRMRVAPGLTGEARAVNCDGHSIVECKVEDVARYVARGKERA